MNFYQLRQFQEVVKCKNITKAAENLYISQPALTLSIKKLESELGVPLFDRSRSGVSLTAAGTRFAEHVNLILSEMDTAVAEVRRSVQQPLKLRFCSAATASLRYFIPLFVRDNPEVEVSSSFLSQDEIEPALIYNKYDIAFSVGPIKNAQISSMPFYEEYLLVSVPESDPIAKKHTISLNELNGKDLLVLNVPGYWNQQMKTWIHNHYFMPKMHVIDDHALYLAMASKTNYYSTSSNIARQNNEPPAHKTDLRIRDTIARATYYVCYRKDKVQNINVFRQWVLDNYTTLFRQQRHSVFTND